MLISGLPQPGTQGARAFSLHNVFMIMIHGAFRTSSSGAGVRFL